ncbi:pentatricopeptide repeat-containing protein At4g21065 [Lycium ferocissimum]|uniref:pentatricopeptide repeat-containing protein At4g21065 n=1 Tax=Lycium ferocissimum TaxID=112874 RepID=UPI002815F468|nr:pentatricopeptide repeat-containing protein At4g21065 [Lycium ferocissimum]
MLVFLMKILSSYSEARFHHISVQLHRTIQTFTSSITRGPKCSLVDKNKKLNELSKLGQTDEARKMFDKMPDRDEFTWTTMVAAYANEGRLVEARQVFKDVPIKNSITWSSLICGYCKHGFEIEGFELFWQMQSEGHRPSQFTLGSVLRMCAIKGLLSRGEQIHGYAIKTCFDMNVFVMTGLIDMYAKCKRILEAEFIFDIMSNGKNHVTWTAMISGYSQNGDALRAIKCFSSMRAEGIEANQYTFPGVLSSCAALCDLRFGLQVHSCIVNGGFEANVFVQSALIDMYSKCGDLHSAKKALELMEVNHAVSWNSMMLGCVRHGLPEEAVSLFKRMYASDMEVDEFTYPSVLNSLACMHDVKNGKCLHCLIVKTGYQSYKLVSNALVDMYAKQGDLPCAMSVFNSMVEKDVISWTSLVTGCAHNGSYEEALKLFCEMRVAEIKPDQIITASVLSCCSELALLELGQQVHVDFIKSGLEASLSVDNSLMTMYANCGCLEDAKKVFNSMQMRNVISWTALIVAYAQNGKGKESLRFYDEMIASGIEPDFITFIGLLFACSHTGLVDDGKKYFNSMKKDYGIRPSPDHYACMIDLLGRAGKIQEAEKLVNEMDIEPDATVWKALLAACRVHGSTDLAEKASMALFQLEPQDAVPYVMLSNIYSAAGKWEDAAKLRRKMKLKGVNKEPGYSWIEMNGVVHTFISEERSHPKSDEIYSKLDDVIALIKEAGYVPDLNFSLHDINEEGREQSLSYHSEKLAIAFGLLCVPKGVPIRIYKNLRVCGDCHNAMKFVSRVFDRHIILRDSNRFHHFKEGICSCGDYW